MDIFIISNKKWKWIIDHYVMWKCLGKNNPKQVYSLNIQIIIKISNMKLA